VGNIPTEVVLEALEQCGVKLPIENGLDDVMAINAEMSAKFSAE
jgi:hypothetical protein